MSAPKTTTTRHTNDDRPGERQQRPRQQKQPYQQSSAVPLREPFAPCPATATAFDYRLSDTSRFEPANEQSASSKTSPATRDRNEKQRRRPLPVAVGGGSRNGRGSVGSELEFEPDPTRPVISVSGPSAQTPAPPAPNAAQEASGEHPNEWPRPEVGPKRTDAVDIDTNQRGGAGNNDNDHNNNSNHNKANQPTDRRTTQTSVGSLQTMIDSSSDIEQVRQSFVALIRYNTMQYFHISAVLYSVMIIGFIIYHSSVMLRANDPDQSHRDRNQRPLAPPPPTHPFRHSRHTSPASASTWASASSAAGAAGAAAAYPAETASSWPISASQPSGGLYFNPRRTRAAPRARARDLDSKSVYESEFEFRFGSKSDSVSRLLGALRPSVGSLKRQRQRRTVSRPNRQRRTPKGLRTAHRSAADLSGAVRIRIRIRAPKSEPEFESESESESHRKSELEPGSDPRTQSLVHFELLPLNARHNKRKRSPTSSSSPSYRFPTSRSYLYEDGDSNENENENQNENENAANENLTGPEVYAKNDRKKCRTGSDMKPLNLMLAWILVLIQLTLTLLLGAVFGLTLFKFSLVRPNWLKHKRQKMPRQQQQQQQTADKTEHLRNFVANFGLILTQLLLHLPIATFQIGPIILNSSSSSSDQHPTGTYTTPAPTTVLLPNEPLSNANSNLSSALIDTLNKARLTYGPDDDGRSKRDRPTDTDAAAAALDRLRLYTQDNDYLSGGTSQAPPARAADSAYGASSDLFCALLRLKLPLCAFLVLAYISPALFDNSPMGVKVFAALTIWFPYTLWTLLQLRAVFASSSYHASNDTQSDNSNSNNINTWQVLVNIMIGGGDGVATAGKGADEIRSASASQGDTNNSNSSEAVYLLVYLFCILLALFLGLLKRYRWMRCVSQETFEGATQLIEAKVSLEQQRQQQETLLLSVLPAYVAEQVKRNMVKKIIGGGTGACCVTETVTQQQQLQQQQQQQDPALSAYEDQNRASAAGADGQPIINAGASQIISTPISVSSSSLASRLAQSNICRPFLHKLSKQTIRKQQNTKVDAGANSQQQQRACFAQIAQTSGATSQQTSVVSTVLVPLDPTPKLEGSDDNGAHQSAVATKQGTGAKVIQNDPLNSPATSSCAPASLPVATQTTTSASHCDDNLQQQKQQQQQQQQANSNPNSGNINNTYNNHYNQQQLQLQLQQQQQQQQQNILPLQQANNNLATQSARRGFNELYIRTYNNVSLLYGDIVGFTRLCTQLSSSQLVRVLNDLFSYFDHLAERHRIMRIKILGDCYYGVSGIPEFAVMGAKSRASRNDNHAINCVNMGLDMIDYIKCLNVERTSSHQKGAMDQNNNNNINVGNSSTINRSSEQQQQQLHSGSSGGESSNCVTPMPMFELNMRIGVHSGHIHSGVIGLKKWQFDVWSNDVSIAMHCESSGVAGRVQVTDATIQQLNGAFTFEPSSGAQRDSFLADKYIKTYLIRDLARSNLNIEHGQQQLRASSRSISRSQHEGSLRNSSSNSSRTSSRKRSRINLEQQQQQRQQKQQQSNMTDVKAKVSEPFNDNSNSNERDDEKIRIATVETISQTLLAREPIGSRGLNSYALALDHQDFYPISLKYRDIAIDKLFAHRTRPIGSQFQELASILLLLLIITPLVDRLIFSSSGSNTPDGILFDQDSLPLLLYLLAAVAIVLYCLGYLLRVRSTPNPDNETETETVASAARSPSTVLGCEIAIAIEPQLHANIDNGKSTYQSIGKQILDTQLVRDLIELCSNTSGQFVSFCQNNRLLSRLTNLVASTIVILFLVYLFTIQICPKRFIQNPLPAHHSRSAMVSDSGAQRQQQQQQMLPIKHSDTSSGLIEEYYRLSVILLLMVLDLSMNLFKYRTKVILILVIVVVQIINLTHPLGLMSSIRSDACNLMLDNITSPYGSPEDNTFNNKIPLTYRRASEWSTDALILLMALWCLAYARQLEYTQRVNFLWRNRLNVDHEELEYISGINKVLLENILPSHVVHHYMTHSTEHPKPLTLPSYIRMSFSNMRTLSDELYHEQHDSVAVMFASIPHFYDFYDESDISKQGLGCIALLNEIICDFDKLLLKNKFSRIEKIKTIGSTYMAAAGLRPSHLNSRNSTTSRASQGSCPVPLSTKTLCRQTAIKQHSQSLLECPSTLPGADDKRLALSQQKLNLICMIQFASSLMAALNGINKQSFQVFKLKIGVNTGSVIAGIIGAQRPFYDIWGDCVNIASRMESLGEVGRIQVEEKTAKLLMDCLCLDTYSIIKRGSIDVKGKGGMTTYFVDKRPSHSTTGDNAD